MRGGKRAGSGKKKGTKVSTLAKEIKLRALSSGISPLEYMLGVMRAPMPPGKISEARKQYEHSRRERMAAAAAPYCHARLQSTEVTGAGGGPVKTEAVGESVNTTELARQIAFALRKGVEGKKKI